MTLYPHLFSPVDIGPVRARNRIAQTTHTKGYGLDGTDSQRTIDYYVERARGGAGMLFTDAHLVHPTSTVGMTRKTWGFLPAQREFGKRLTAAVKANGAAVFTQLVHNGLNASASAADDLRVTWGPSAMKSPMYNETPKVMEEADIAEAVEWWARTAENCREAGFDGAEIHLGHGYLLHQFFSPVYNRRTDGYRGDTWEGRTRFAREVIAEVRARTGRDWALGIRLTGTDHVPGGISVEDSARLAAELEADGLVDFVNVTAGDYFDFSRQNATADTPDGYNVETAAAIKAALRRVPVLVVGGIKDPAHAERVIAAGHADVVAMTRALLADPELPEKARTGREAEIVHCVRANQGCMARLLSGFAAGCTVNPAAGRERRLGAGTLVPAAEPARWLVIGGGPAGMRAAGTLAQRGHDVRLVERAARLGGQVELLRRARGRESFGFVVTDLERRMRAAGVRVDLGTEATPELVAREGYDHVLVATGASPSRSGFSPANPTLAALPGADGPQVLTPWDVLGGQPDRLRTPCGRVVVLDDEGNRYTAGTVETLLDGGARVELVTPSPALLPQTAHTIDMAPLYRRLLGKGLTFRPNSWATGIGPDSVAVVHLYTGATEELPADAVVLVTGRVADDALYHHLAGQVAHLHRIGDCVAPRQVDHAIYEGELAGRELWDPQRRYINDGDLERAGS